MAEVNEDLSNIESWLPASIDPLLAEVIYVLLWVCGVCSMSCTVCLQCSGYVVLRVLI